MKRRGLLFWIAVLCLFVGALSLRYARYWHLRTTGNAITVRGSQVDASHTTDPAATSTVPEPLRDFELTDQAGQKFDSHSLAGKVWVGSIFFADCPSTCRVQNQRVAELQQKFADRGVQFVSITCDPTHDTPKRLAEYSQLFNARPESWHFLTGDLTLIKRVGQERFGIAVDELVHSDRLVLFDAQGEVQGTYRSTDRDEFMKAEMALEEMLQDEEAEAAASTAEAHEDQPAPSP